MRSLCWIHIVLLLNLILFNLFSLTTHSYSRVLISFGFFIFRNSDENADVINNVAYVNVEPQWSNVYAKIELLESRLHELAETINNQHHDFKQCSNVMNQYLMSRKDDEKKRRNTDDRLDENHIATTIVQNMNSVISGEVEYAIKQEINGNVLPCKLVLMYVFSLILFIFHI